MAVRAVLPAACALWLTPALAQNALDRVDPSLGSRPRVEDVQKRPVAKPEIIAPVKDTTAGNNQSDIFAGAIRIDGAAAVPLSAFSSVIETYVGRRLSQSDLRALVRSIADVARARGYLFATASIPVQAVDVGIVTVRLDEGHIDRVEIAGSNSKAIKRLLEPLARGGAPERDAVERQLALVADLPGIDVRQVEFERSGKSGILHVQIREAPVTTRARIDNDGPKSVGPVRTTFSVGVNGVLTDGDVLTLEGLSTPFEPGEFGYARAQYAVQPGNDGTILAVSSAIGRSNPDGILGQFDTHGRSFEAGFSASHPFIRSRTRSLWVNLDTAYREIDQSQLATPVRRDRLTTVSASLTGYVPLTGGRLRFGAGVSDGLDIFGATRRGNPLASRPDGDAHFVKGYAWADWFGKIAGPVSLRLSGSGQIADRPLLAAEELAIGGPRFGRGYDYAERTGDKGLLGSAELQADVRPLLPKWVDWAHAYGFADAGVVGNLQGGYGGGDLYSAGAGLRVGFAHKFDLGVEAALPIDTIRFDSGDRSPRFRLSLGVVFD